ncbi:MAG: hypothetical protein WCK86_10210 [Planctomycetia bacterium]
MAETAIQGRLWGGGHGLLANSRFLTSLSAYLGMGEQLADAGSIGSGQALISTRSHAIFRARVAVTVMVTVGLVKVTQ